ncbi:MAG: nucleoside-diphosphate kinase [Kiritimatiellae bacterium]|nr:nucleoside-diphosphate kinase [Kiritimatiellia bacterium]
MATELGFVLINPYTIAKSRTGGVIGRCISRTGLELVAARMFGPSRELVEEYAASIRARTDAQPAILELLSDYLLKNYTPDPATGRRNRVMLILFRGENAVEKIMAAAGSLTSAWGGGDTIRDTFGDYIEDDDGSVRYFEPAVLVAPTRERAGAILKLWARYSERDGGLIEDAVDVPLKGNVEKTLVLIKPDNFRFPSARPGNVIDIFSRSGLRIIGAKVHRMSVKEATEFYAPVHDVLCQKFNDSAAKRGADALRKEFGFDVPDSLAQQVGETLGPIVGDQQFNQIVKFMTGFFPNERPDPELALEGREKCLALVYDGVDAVRKIRYILGPTDPTEAEVGSVRREYGHDVMVNAAHASDSAKNAAREMRIIRVAEDSIGPWVEKYYGTE